jgi:hypothetical protein
VAAVAVAGLAPVLMGLGVAVDAAVVVAAAGATTCAFLLKNRPGHRPRAQAKVVWAPTTTRQQRTTPATPQPHSPNSSYDSAPLSPTKRGACSPDEADRWCSLSLYSKTLSSSISLDMHALPITVLRNAAVEPELPYCWCGANGIVVVRDGQTSCCKCTHCYELPMAVGREL